MLYLLFAKVNKKVKMLQKKEVYVEKKEKWD